MANEWPSFSQWNFSRDENQCGLTFTMVMVEKKWALFAAVTSKGTSLAALGAESTTDTGKDKVEPQWKPFSSSISNYIFNMTIPSRKKPNRWLLDLLTSCVLQSVWYKGLKSLFLLLFPSFFFFLHLHALPVSYTETYSAWQQTSVIKTRTT